MEVEVKTNWDSPMPPQPGALVVENPICLRNCIQFLDTCRWRIDALQSYKYVNIQYPRMATRELSGTVIRETFMSPSTRV